MTLTVDEALQRGVAAHQAGNIAEADKYYTAVLNAQPKHPDANHNMGVLGVGVGKLEEALPFFKTAIEVNPNVDQFWISYISALIDVGRSDEARFSLKLVRENGARGDAFDQLDQRIQKNLRLAAVSSRDPPLENLQVLVDLFDQGELQETLDRVKELLRDFPASGVLLNLQGAAYSQLGNLDEGIQSYRRAIEIDPDYVDAYNNIGIALAGKGDLDGALYNYNRAIEIQPELVEAHNNMGNTLQKKGDLDAAIECYLEAIKRQPDHVSAYNNMGTALNKKGDFEEAIGSYMRAIKINPSNADANYNMGNALQQNRNLSGALYHYKQVVGCKADHAEAYNNMALVQRDRGDIEQAIHDFMQAIHIQPDYTYAYFNMAETLKEKGDLEGAMHHNNMALETDPEHTDSRLQKLYFEALYCDWGNTAKKNDLLLSLGLTSKAVPPFSMLAFEDSPSRHRSRSEMFAKEKFNFHPLPINCAPTKKLRRLRIGYFSADFRNHPVANLIIRVLELHNRDDFEIYAYSYGPAATDSMRIRVASAVDNFCEVSGRDDLDVVKLARKDNIDIAVDLGGYTLYSRPSICAYRAAPIQINYLGFPGTMGADFIDYIVVDSVLVPAEHRQYYSENLICLPNSYMATDNTREISASALSRQEMGLPENSVVFCAFNNSYKVTPREFDIWMRLLSQVEGSVLWLRSAHKKAEENLRVEAEKRGVDASRLIFAERVWVSEHLARHKLADLFLDTFIFNAHSTAVDALWAGLPVVTKLGAGFAARVAGSLLTSLGMTELVTSTEEAYEALALDLATNPDRLSRVKQTLSENLLTTPLFDSEQFTKDLESGYQRVYERYIAGQAPDDILVF